MSGDRYFITDQKGLYFITFTVVDWMDVFTRTTYKQVIVDSLNHCHQQKGLEVFCWCLMTNHLHLIVRATGEPGLSDVIRDFKKFTASAIIKLIKEGNESRREWLLDKMEWHGRMDSRITKYKFWREDNHAIFLDPAKTDMIAQKINYIHQNPIRAGIVIEPNEYLYSSALDYSGRVGLVKVTVF
jgi:putative transposase